MTISKKLLWFLLFLLVIGVLFFVFRKEILFAVAPKLTEVKVASVAIAEDSAKVELLLTIANTRALKFSIASADLEFYDDTVLLMTYHNPTVRTFARGEVEVQSVLLSIPIEQVTEQIRLHKGEDSVYIRIVGSFQFICLFGTFKRDVDMKVAVVVPIPPKITLTEAEFVGKHDGLYGFLLHITLNNENKRSLEMRKISYYMSGEDLLNISGYVPVVSIAALDSTFIVVPVKIHLKDKAGIISRIILDKDMVNYHFVMKATLVTLSGLVEEDVPVTISANGQVELYDRKRKDAPKITWKNMFKRKKK